MADVNVYEAFKELIERLFSGDEEIAKLAASDPEELLSAFGVTDEDLAEMDFRQVVADCYHDYDLPESTKYALDNYVAGGAAPDHFQVKEPPAYSGGHQGAEHAVQHLQYVTYATYENHEEITREIVQQQFLIDQSDNRMFEVDNSNTFAGFFGGDISVENNNALGDGAVANSGTNIQDSELGNTVIGDENQTANIDVDASVTSGDGGEGIGGESTSGAATSGDGGTNTVAGSQATSGAEASAADNEAMDDLVVSAAQETGSMDVAALAEVLGVTPQEAQQSLDDGTTSLEELRAEAAEELAQERFAAAETTPGIFDPGPPPGSGEPNVTAGDTTASADSSAESGASTGGAGTGGNSDASSDFGGINVNFAESDPVDPFPPKAAEEAADPAPFDPGPPDFEILPVPDDPPLELIEDDLGQPGSEEADDQVGV